MRVKLTTDRGLCGRVQYAGQVYDLPEGEAKRLLALGQAEPAPETKAPGKKPPRAEKRS